MEDSSLRCRRIGAPLVIPPGQGDYFVWQQGYRGGTHVSLFPFVDLNGLSGAATGAIFLLHPGEVVELVAGGVTYFVAGRKPSSTELPLRTTQRFDLDAPPPTPTAGAARRQA